MRRHERELLKLKGEQLAEALRTLPTRAGGADVIDSLLERAFEFGVPAKLVQGEGAEVPS